MSFVLSVGVIYPINQLDKRVRYIQFKYSMTGGQVSQKEDNRYVNIFHKHNYCIIHYVSTYYKTYCFTFQKRLFCNVKAQVLPSKTAAFAMPKRSYQFLTELSLQNPPPFRQQSYYLSGEAKLQTDTEIVGRCRIAARRKQRRIYLNVVINACRNKAAQRVVANEGSLESSVSTRCS